MAGKGGNFEGPQNPAGHDKVDTSHPKDAAEGLSFARVHDAKTEAVKPADSVTEQLHRQHAETQKAIEEHVTHMASLHKSLAAANFPPDHDFHPDNVIKQHLKDHKEGTQEHALQKKMVAAIKGDLHPSQVTA